GAAVFTGRAVVSVGVAAVIVVLVLVALGVEGARGRLERERPEGLGRVAWVVIGLIGAVVAAGIVPIVLVANDARDLMEQGRSAASRGLAAARNGDTIAATAAFNQASVVFGRARDKLDSPLLSGGLAVPLVA